MAENRVTQVYTESLTPGTPNLRATQVYSEALTPGVPNLRITQLYIEVLTPVSSPYVAQLPQNPDPITSHTPENYGALEKYLIAASITDTPVPSTFDLESVDEFIETENILPDYDVETYAHFAPQNYGWLGFLAPAVYDTIYIGVEIKLPDHSWVFMDMAPYQPQEYLLFDAGCRPVGIMAITFIDFSRGLSMDELLGTMDSLVGTMDGLGAVTAAKPTRLLGLSNGDIWQEDPAILLDNSQPFEVVLTSKVFTVPNLDSTVGEIRLNFKILMAPVDDSGYIDLFYSKNDGGTWQLAKRVPVLSTSIGLPVLIRSRKLINSRRVMWKAVSSNIKFDMTGYEIHEYPGGESKT